MIPRLLFNNIEFPSAVTLPILHPFHTPKCLKRPPVVWSIEICLTALVNTCIPSAHMRARKRSSRETRSDKHPHILSRRIVPRRSQLSRIVLISMNAQSSVADVKHGSSHHCAPLPALLFHESLLLSGTRPCRWPAGWDLGSAKLSRARLAWWLGLLRLGAQGISLTTRTLGGVASSPAIAAMRPPRRRWS